MNSSCYSNVCYVRGKHDEISGVYLNLFALTMGGCKGWISGALAVDETEKNMFLFLISWQVASITFPQDKNHMPNNIPYSWKGGKELARHQYILLPTNPK